MDGRKGAGPDPTSKGHDTDVVAVGGFPHGEVLDMVGHCWLRDHDADSLLVVSCRHVRLRLPSHVWSGCPPSAAAHDRTSQGRSMANITGLVAAVPHISISIDARG